MIAVVDYGVGNLFSLKSSLKFLGLDCVVTSKKEDLIKADKIILPGVGAFGDAMMKLRETGLVETVKEQAKIKPLLGICLGMQLLFDKSLEFGEHEGLGLIRGIVAPLSDDIDPSLKIPHMGWNTLDLVREHPVLNKLPLGDNGRHAYFVHSYHFRVADPAHLIAHVDYAGPVTAIVGRDTMVGAQFHPEKSQSVGLRLIANFLRWRP
ncbi:MAG TPA: imidazole glycerol phosphate synthase subunit HisH [Clostridiales bacterium]|nr:imidazole glycerol phosphate synthase subunit HisH [Clostridiales bacterium]